MRRLPLCVALTLTTIAASCGKADTVQNAGGPAAAPEARTVDVVQVIEQPLDVELSLPGELTPYQDVAIYPRVTGFVRSVSVDRGSRVGAGDVVAVLDAPELVAQRAEAQARLQAAESQLAASRARADADRATFEKLRAASRTPGVVAGNDVLIAEKTADASQSLVASAQQTIEALRQSLNAIRDMEGYLRVTAPFAGVVTERNVHPGALVGPSTGGSAPPMLRVVETNRLRLVVPVPEAYTSQLKIGSAIPFSVAAYPGRSFAGRIARIAHAVDVATRTMAVELDVANGGGQLAPGTFTTVKWPVRRSGPSLFVPSASVTSTTDRTFVVRVRDGKTEWIDVRTGLTSGPLIEVFGDLKAGDEVAGRGTDELRPDTTVQPRRPKPAV